METEDKGSRIEQYIRYYQELLEEKGYNEQNLCNGEPPGTFAGRIKEAFNILSEKFSSDLGTYGAIVQTFGKPTPGEGKMNFDFIFSYDPPHQMIRLEAIHINGEDFQAKITPKHRGSIPDLHQALAHIRDERPIAMTLQPKPQQKSGKGKGYSLN